MVETTHTGPRVRKELPVRQEQQQKEHPRQSQLSVPTFRFGRNLCPGAAVQGRGSVQKQEPPARGCSPVREAARPAAPRGRVSAGAPQPPTRRIPRPPAPLLPAALPRCPARSPARPLAHRHLHRPVAGYDRHVGIRVGKLPVFHVASFQRHLPAARRVRRALPADGGEARWPCSGAPVRAAPESVTIAKVTAGRRGPRSPAISLRRAQAALGDSAPTSGLSPGCSGQAFRLLASASAHRLTRLALLARVAGCAGVTAPLLFLGRPCCSCFSQSPVGHSP